jgi:hypothetical protein
MAHDRPPPLFATYRRDIAWFASVIGLTSIVVYGDWKGYAPANSIWMTLIFVTGVLLGAGVHALLGHKTIEDTP